MKHTILYLILAITALAACSKKNHSSKTNYKFRSADGAPDYKDISYWAAHPWKWDPSDSVPRDLQSIYMQDSTVDVFFSSPHNAYQ